MSQQFQCSIDATGNICVRGGWVLCPRHGTTFEVADLAIPLSGVIYTGVGPTGFFREFPGSRGFRASLRSVFLGGSGANLKIASAPTGLPKGYFTPGSSNTWNGVSSNSITISLAGDGSATIADSTDVIASAAAGSFTLVPEGNFASTSYGQSLNGGSPFTLTTIWEGGLTTTGFPLAGDIWIEVTETSAGSGEVASVAGPKFGSAMPSPSGAMTPVLIAESDGSGNLIQYQEGPVVWSGGGGGGGGSGITWVTLTSAAYLALTTPDPDTIYDITDA